MKKIAVAVTNDLTTDQRVHKSCDSMLYAGFRPLLIGRKLKDSTDIQRPYPTKRLKLLFNQGALFYAFFNIRLFLVLMTTKCNAIWANDLDTLLGCYLASRIKNIPLIFDSHEYFTEVPEIQHKPIVKKVWQAIEKHIVPKLRFAITVSHSIATLFHKQYGVSFDVMRNIPVLKALEKQTRCKADLGFSEHELLLILQGSGINIDRGAEELLEAINKTNEVNLLIIGGGDVLAQLKQFVHENGLNQRVKFLPKMAYHEMMSYTVVADIGLTLDKNTNINYQYSLPNKLFDYIHAGIPVMASPLFEVQQIINQNEVGWVLKEHSVLAIVQCLNELKNNPAEIKLKAKNCEKVSLNFDWKKEAKIITDILKQIE